MPDKEEERDWEDWANLLVRLIILTWSGAILTLTYVQIPGVPHQKIDPTFIAGVFTGTLATFGVQRANASKKCNYPCSPPKK